MAPFAGSERRASLAPVALAAALVVAGTLLGCLTWDGNDLLTPAAWLLGVVLASSYSGGIAGGLTAAFLSTAALLFTFTDPRWSLRVDDGADGRAVIAFAIMTLLIALWSEAVETARRRADRALEEQQSAVRLLDAVLEHAPVGIAFFDTDLRFVRVNEELLRINGLPAEDHYGRSVGEVLGDQAVEDVARRVLVSGRPVLDIRFGGTHRRTGRPLHVDASYYPVRDEQGVVVGVGVVVHDTTGEVVAELDRELLFERLTRLQSATSALAAARTTDDVAAAVLAEVRSAAGGTGASLAVRHGDGIRVLAGDDDAATLLAEAVNRRDVVTGRDGAAIALPLVVHGEVTGAVGISTDGGRQWDEQERRFLQAIATQCSQALQRTALTDSEREARDRLAFLAEATARLSTTLDVEEALDRLGALVVPRLGEWCSVHLRGSEATTELQPLVDAVARTGRAEVAKGVLAVPMVAQDRVVGVLALGTASPDVELATEVAARAAQAVRNAELYRDRAHVADVLQSSLLPPATAEVPGVDVATRFVPVGEGNEVGGDFYDVFRIGRARRPSDAWAVVIGDARGKGAEAAAITGAARNAVRAAALHTRSPAAMLAELNEVLLVVDGERPDELEPIFCTAAVAAVTPTGVGAHLVVAVGGHPLPMLLRADGTTTVVGRPGSLLGIVDDPLLEDVEVDLRPGEALVLYTDGVTERHSGQRFFDEEGLAATLSRCAGFTAEALAERIEVAARAFVEDDLVDDIAVVVVRAPTRTATSASTSTDLPVDANAPRLARRFVTEVLGALGRDDLVEAGALLASEIVTNAVLHGSAPVRVSVEPGEGRVRVAVADSGDGRPELVDAPADALHGRGIALVAQLSTRWGVDELPSGSGKSVWFELA